MDGSDFDEILEVFLEEAPEIIDELEVRTKRLRAIEKSKFGQELKSVLRLAHNLKGAARTVGLDEIEKLAHEIEDVLLPSESDQSRVTDSVVRDVLRTLTSIQMLTREVERDRLSTEIDEEGPDEGESASEDGYVASVSEAPSAKETSIRVDRKRFDRIIGFSGEFMVSQNRMQARNQSLDTIFKELQQISKRSSEGFGLLAPVLQEIGRIVRRDRSDLLDFSHLVADMSDAMRHLRMVPLTRSKAAWRRVVRETSHQLGKEINITIKAGEIEVDKQVLDQLQDPMMHLLRNAIGHGIESSAERSAAGKPEVGKVLIVAAVAGAMLRLEVSDDGRGIDLNRVREAVTVKGIIPADTLTKMSDEEMREILFEPGFSTADEVSRLSGRGVGLDVVRSYVEGLGGRVSISPTATLGGTTFVLSVPLSILSTLGLFVRSQGTVYAIPVEHVERTHRVNRSEVKMVDGKTVIELTDGPPVRILWLSEVMGKRPDKSAAVIKVVILSRSEIKLGLVFDEVVGQQEFVTQALPWNFAEVPGVNGAIIMADGSLAVSLDIAHVFDQARLSLVKGVKLKIGQAVRDSKRILVVDDSMASRTVGRNMLRAAGYEILLASDGRQAWDLLTKEPVDLLVSDVDMPNMDGLELTKKIRGSSSLSDLPVILCTAMDSPEDIAKGAAVGADEYVIKGTFDQGTLLELVAKYI